MCFCLSNFCLHLFSLSHKEKNHISPKHSLLQECFPDKKLELDYLKFLIVSVLVLILHAVRSASAQTSSINSPSSSRCCLSVRGDRPVVPSKTSLFSDCTGGLLTPSTLSSKKQSLYSQCLHPSLPLPVSKQHAFVLVWQTRCVNLCVNVYISLYKCGVFLFKFYYFFILLTKTFLTSGQ